MSGPNRPTGALPPETAERVHAYLAAFLSPPAAAEAYDEVAEDVAFWGDLDPVQVFAAAHRSLASRLRIAPEVEVLVLAEDSDVPVDEIGQILELAPSEVRAMLDEALAELAEPDEVPAARPLRDPEPEPEAAPAPDIGEPVVSDDGPTSDRSPALVTDEPEPEPAPVAPEPRPVPAAPTRRADTPEPVVNDEGVVDATAATPASSAASPSQSPLRDASRDRSAEPAAGPASGPAPAAAPPARRWVPALLILGTILLIAIVIASLAGGEQDPTTVGIEDGCAEAPICVTQAVLTDTVDSQGVPGEGRETFTLDDDVKLWFAFDRNREGPVSLEVRWYRDADELYRSDFRLAAVDRISLTLAGLFMEQPGAYRVEVVGDGRVLLERDFAVTGSPAVDSPS